LRDFEKKKVSYPLHYSVSVLLYLFETYFLTLQPNNIESLLAKEFKTLQRYEYVVRGAGATEDEIKALITGMKGY